ncbi:hypothetical protein FisN_9Hu088 [Fistulifera solaris]|jgi:hypothetical protein|uniref:Uncharacterized protein n=1 Tax=Fistulifera solaris TaxID=1519565 RepID=A0A1Z5K2L1_FISSO|nr:hypothetical protein FisN_9Hu088 [Fistulifera solaris]|eukprot:GAX20376.1 hypothetical protein FisN_9Hu088 [Fistulifera solaris]
MSQDKSATVDDEEELVRQVLKESPVEKRGVRDEWSQHVGWHRQEDVHELRDPSVEKSNVRRGKKAVRETSWLLVSFMLIFRVWADIEMASQHQDSNGLRQES